MIGSEEEHPACRYLGAVISKGFPNERDLQEWDRDTVSISVYELMSDNERVISFGNDPDPMPDLYDPDYQITLGSSIQPYVRYVFCIWR